MVDFIISTTDGNSAIQLSQSDGNSSFCWSSIVNNFEVEFKKTFSADKKAHFDNLPDEFKQIDGAKPKWCNLLLLDAIIYLLKNDSFNIHFRRAFSQPIVLYECILTELKRINLTSWTAITAEKSRLQLIADNTPHTRKDGLVNSQPFSPQTINQHTHLTLSPLAAPWNEMPDLVIHLKSGPSSKAKGKFASIAKLLTTHSEFSKYDFNLNVILQVVISRVLFTINNTERTKAVKRVKKEVVQFVVPQFGVLSINKDVLETNGQMSTSNSNTDFATLNYPIITNTQLQQDGHEVNSDSVTPSGVTSTSGTTSGTTSYESVSNTPRTPSALSIESTNTSTSTSNDPSTTSSTSTSRKQKRVVSVTVRSEQDHSGVKKKQGGGFTLSSGIAGPQLQHPEYFARLNTISGGTTSAMLPLPQTEVQVEVQSVTTVNNEECDYGMLMGFDFNDMVQDFEKQNKSQSENTNNSHTHNTDSVMNTKI